MDWATEHLDQVRGPRLSEKSCQNVCVSVDSPPRREFWF